MAITFQNQEISFKLPETVKTRNWIKQIIASEKKEPGQINFVFTSDEELLKLNRQFLDHDTYTDIITFDSCEGKTINGDIIISVERVQENAKKFSAAASEELKRVIIHGILHLCGYKDKSKADAELMRKKENLALKKFPA